MGHMSNTRRHKDSDNLNANINPKTGLTEVTTDTTDRNDRS